MALNIRDGDREPQILASNVNGSGEHEPKGRTVDIVPGTAATNLGKAEDAAHASGDTGVAMLAVRQDTRAVSGGTTGDYSVLGLNAQGDLYVNAAQTRATVTASPTADTSAYADGDLIGGKLSFTSATRFSGGSALLQNALLVDQAKQSANIDLVLFGADPSGTAFTDQAAFDVADADMDKIIAVIRFGTYGDWITFNDNGIAQYTPPGGVPIKLTTGTTLYGALVSRAAPTFAASTDIKAILVLTQD